MVDDDLGDILARDIPWVSWFAGQKGKGALGWTCNAVNAAAACSVHLTKTHAHALKPMQETYMTARLISERDVQVREGMRAEQLPPTQRCTCV